MAVAIGVTVGVVGSTAGITPAQAQNTTSVTIICANEGETCLLPNLNNLARTVTYGKNGAFVSLSVFDQIGCNNTSFGRDPLVGVVKNCTYTVDVSSLNWTQCAQENSYCSFLGTRKLVRYGLVTQPLAINWWAYLPFADGIMCNNVIFGDPFVGLMKTCQITN
jgi:hypothetical protein